MFAGMRRHDRKDARIEILVQDEHGWEIPFESVNISPTGVFVRSAYLFEIGQIHRLIMHAPRSREFISIRARVVRVEVSERGLDVPGMAYEFIHETDRTAGAISDLVAAL
jgi:hypothetical protein